MSKVITAAKNGYKGKLDTLLAEGYSVHCRDENNATALFWAACRGHPGICKSLILAGADINACVVWGATPLHAAADTGHVECIKLLMEFDADINAQNNRGDTPLHLACYRGFTDIVSLLINYDADVSLENNQGKTPYVEADSQKHIGILKILQPQMNVLKQNHRITQQIPPLPNIQYSTECIQNSPKIFSFSGSNMNNISFARTSEPQENEDRVGSFSETDRLSSDVNILSLDAHVGQTSSLRDDINLQSHNSVSLIRTEDNGSSHIPSWIRENVDCKRSEQRQMDGKYLQWEMQRLRRSLKEQSSQIQKLQEENERLKEFADRHEKDRIRADTNCRKMALQIARLKSVSDDSNSVSDFSPTSDFSDSPDQIFSTTHPFPFTKYLSTSGPSEMGSSSLNNDYRNKSSAISVPQNLSYKSLQELYQQVPDWKLLDLHLITKKVSSVWLQVSEHIVKLDENDQGIWTLGQNYELRDNSPLNRSTEEKGNGTCSLVFRIKYKNHHLILKMITNLIDLHQHGHNQGYSLSDFLHYHFGAELIPTELPQHRNLIKIIHHYTGTTLNFEQFHNLVVPPDLTGVEMAYETLFVVMPEYQQNLKSFMENTSFNSSLETFLLQQLYQLLSAIYLLEKNYIVHRDIKPDNIFLDFRLQPVIADFGFAKKLRSVDGKIPVRHYNQIDAANNFAWTPEMIRWKNSVDPLTNLTEEDVYKFTDSYSLGRMFYNFLTTEGQKFPQVSTLKPHYSDNDLPDLPYFLSPHFCYILKQLVRDKPSDRMTTRQAMLWAGMLMFPPSPEEMSQKLNVKHYLQAKLMTLLVMKPTVFQSNGNQFQLTVEESIQQNIHELEADFLCNVTVDEFWDIYQSIS